MLKIIKYFFLILLGVFAIRGLGVSALKLGMVTEAFVYTGCGCAIIFGVVVMGIRDLNNYKED